MALRDCRDRSALLSFSCRLESRLPKTNPAFCGARVVAAAGASTPDSRLLLWYFVGFRVQGLSKVVQALDQTNLIHRVWPAHPSDARTSSRQTNHHPFILTSFGFSGPRLLASCKHSGQLCSFDFVGLFPGRPEQGPHFVEALAKHSLSSIQVHDSRITCAHRALNQRTS